MYRDYALSFKPLPDTVEAMAELIRTDGFIRFPAALEPDHCDQLVANIFSLEPEKRSPLFFLLSSSLSRSLFLSLPLSLSVSLSPSLPLSLSPSLPLSLSLLASFLPSSAYPGRAQTW
eukprot:COSAG03_NODE_522_length_7202_cov_16.938336_4_plen_118_part_00